MQNCYMILLSFKFLTWYAAMGLLCPSSLPMREPHHRKCAWITYMFMTAYILQSNLQGYDLKLSATNYWSSDKLPTSLRFIMVCGCFICLVLSVFFFFLVSAPYGICSWKFNKNPPFCTICDWYFCVLNWSTYFNLQLNYIEKLHFAW